MKSEITNDENKLHHYISHVILGGHEIIPSDSFEIGGNEYVLLKIIKSTDDITFLKIICSEGSNIGNIYLIPKTDFEDKTLKQIQENLNHYQH